MATKAQFATETIGLWEDSRGALYVLTQADKAVSNALRTGHEEFSLLTYLQAQSNTMFKVLVEGVAIAAQPLEPAQEKEIGRLEKVVLDKQFMLDDFAHLHETAIIKAVKEKNLTETLALWADMPQRLCEEIQSAQQGVQDLRLVNVQKANTHVAQSYQKRKVSPGSNGNSHNLPKLTEGQEYNITRHSQILTLAWDGPNDWEFEDNGDTVVSSEAYPKLSIGSWTQVGRVMRVLLKDYTPKDNGFSVKKGDLGHREFAKVKSGGTQNLSVTIIE